MNCRREWSAAMRQSKWWPSFQWSHVTWKEAEEKAGACDAGWGQGGEEAQAEPCEPGAAGKQPGAGAKSQRWDVSGTCSLGQGCDRHSHIVNLMSVDLEIFRSAVGRHKHRDWGNVAVGHKCISAPSNHRKHTISTGTAKPDELFNKICQDHYFWEKKNLIRSLLIAGNMTWVHLGKCWALAFAYFCISAYGTKINNLILAVRMILFCFPE